MRGKRLWQTLRLYSMLKVSDRVEYLRKHEVFGALGEHVIFEDRRIPLYARLIRIGNNVVVASHVLFVTHDVTYHVINPLLKGQNKAVQEKIGCIEIGDNVFIGSNSTILYDVRIGNNVVIGAGSLVNQDIPDNSVAAGVPARVIGTFDDFVNKRLHEERYPVALRPERQTVSDGMAEWAWKDFESRRP